MAALFILFYAFCFNCIGVQAITYDCDTAECNKLFIFPAAFSDAVTINCHNDGDCDELVIYSASTSLIVNCLGTNSCNGINVYCGDFDPPSATYSTSDMNGSNIYCNVHCDADPAPGCIHSLLSCRGNGIKSCSIKSYPDATPDPITNIESTTLECNINSPNSCYMDCDDSFCSNSYLLCHNADDTSGCNCFGGYCSGVRQTFEVTYAPTTNAPTTNAPTVSPIDVNKSITIITTRDVITSINTNVRNPSLVAAYKPTTNPTKLNEHEVIESTNNGMDHTSNYIAVTSKEGGDKWWMLWVAIGVIVMIAVIVIAFRVKKRRTTKHGTKLSDLDLGIEEAVSVTSGGSTHKGSIAMSELQQAKKQTNVAACIESDLMDSDSGENDDLYVGSQAQYVITGGNTLKGDTVTVREEDDEDDEDDEHLNAMYGKRAHYSEQHVSVGCDMQQEEGEEGDDQHDTDAMYTKKGNPTADGLNKD